MKSTKIFGQSFLALASLLVITPGANAQFFDHQASTVSQLNSTRAQLESQLQAAVSSGGMSWAEANQLRSQLSANANLQAQLSFDGLSYAEAANLTTQLGQIQARLNATGFGYGNGYLNTGWNSGWNNGYYGNGYYNGGFGGNLSGMISVQGVNQQRISVYNRINQALHSGRITQRQWNDLMRELDTIQHEMRASNNGQDFISQSASARISSRLSNLNNRLERAIAGRGGRFWF